MEQTPREVNGPGWVDGGVALGLLAGTVLYLSRFPHSLSFFDESIWLYDAKRVLRGAVLYRDVFNMITPGWMYLMALLFGVFGTDVAVARLAVAVMHGGTVAAIYACCRTLRIRRGLSWPAALAYLVVAQPAWPIASQHWLSTLLSTVALWLCALHLHDRTRWSFLLGVVLGLFVGVQQQRAAFVAAGVLLWLAADYAIEWRYAVSRPMRMLVSAVAWVVAGLSVVVVPLLVWIVARAGLYNVWRALVIFPLFDYAGFSHPAWGEVSLVVAWYANFTFPRLLKYLPVALLPAIARVAWLVARRRGLDEVRDPLLLIVYGAASVLSIAYYPDFIHLAFITPVFFVALAETAEWTAKRLRLPQPFARVTGSLAGLALLGVFVMRLDQNLTRMRSRFRFSRASAFGRVDFSNEQAVRLYDQLHDLLQRTPTRYLYCYPLIAHLYLMLDVDNPTPHGDFVTGYSGPDLVQQVVDALQATQPPYVVFVPHFGGSNDPVSAWITEHYEPVDGKERATWQVYRRKPG